MTAKRPSGGQAPRGPRAVDLAGDPWTEPDRRSLPPGEQGPGKDRDRGDDEARSRVMGRGLAAARRRGPESE